MTIQRVNIDSSAYLTELTRALTPVSMGLDTDISAFSLNPLGSYDGFSYTSIPPELFEIPQLTPDWNTTTLQNLQFNFNMPTLGYQNMALKLPDNFDWSNLFKSNFKFDFSNIKSNGKRKTSGIDGKCINYTKGEYTPADRRKTKKNNEDYIAELQPVVQEKIRQLEAYAKENNIPFKICDGYRTEIEQQRMINKYKNQQGRAAGLNTSPHRSGRAIDIQCDGLLTEEQSTKLGLYAESIGLRWGGRFKTCRERWHFDMPGTKA